MNSLSKVTLLVTLLTVSFAGFAMDSADFPSLGQSAEKTTDAATVASKGVYALVRENPVVAAGVAGVTLVTLYGIKKGYNWLYGKSADSEAQDEKKLEDSDVEKGQEVKGTLQGVEVTSDTPAPSKRAGRRNTQAAESQKSTQQSTQRRTQQQTQQQTQPVQPPAPQREQQDQPQQLAPQTQAPAPVNTAANTNVQVAIDAIEQLSQAAKQELEKLRKLNKFNSQNKVSLKDYMAWKAWKDKQNTSK